MSDPTITERVDFLTTTMLDLESLSVQLEEFPKALIIEAVVLINKAREAIIING